MPGVGDLRLPPGVGGLILPPGSMEVEAEVVDWNSMGDLFSKVVVSGFISRGL